MEIKLLSVGGGEIFFQLLWEQNKNKASLIYYGIKTSFILKIVRVVTC